MSPFIVPVMPTAGGCLAYTVPLLIIPVMPVAAYIQTSNVSCIYTPFQHLLPLHLPNNLDFFQGLMKQAIRTPLPPPQQLNAATHSLANLTQQWLQQIEAAEAIPKLPEDPSLTPRMPAANTLSSPTNSKALIHSLNLLAPVTEQLKDDADHFLSADLHSEALFSDDFIQDIEEKPRPDQSFMLSDIPASQWSTEMESFDPERVYRHRENLVIQQGSTEDGLSSGVYIVEVGSSFKPQQGKGPDGFFFENGGSAMGNGRFLYNYRHRFD